MIEVDETVTVIASKFSKIPPKKRLLPPPVSETSYHEETTSSSNSNLQNDDDSDFELSNIRIESTYSCAPTLSQRTSEQNSTSSLILASDKMKPTDSSSPSIPGQLSVNAIISATTASETQRKRPLQSSKLSEEVATGNECHLGNNGSSDESPSKRLCGQVDTHAAVILQNSSSNGGIGVDVSPDSTELSNIETQINIFNNEWPLPSEFVVGEEDASSSSINGPDIVDKTECWKRQCKGRSTLDRYFNMWKSDDFSVYRDVKFEVGREKVSFTAHKFILCLLCENTNAKSLIISSTPNLPVVLPTLEPSAFWKMLNYLYTTNVEIEDVHQALDTLAVAKTIGVRQLQVECLAFLKANISVDNVIKVYCSALDSNDEQLKDMAAAFISRCAGDVLSSDGFLKLKEEDLYNFLRSEDWFIEDEFHVFKNVIRWAIHQHTSSCQRENKPTGSDLRKVIGKALYQIRFTTLPSSDTFVCNMVLPYRGLFTSDETIDITTYLAAKNLPSDNDDDGDVPLVSVPSGFNLYPRVRRELVQSPSSTSENTSERLEIHRSNELPHPSTTNVNSIAGAIQNEKSPRCPKGKRNNSVENNDPGTFSPMVSESPSTFLQNSVTTSGNRDMYLHDYIKALNNSKDTSGDIERIDEEIQITAIPQMRVYLPNLKEFSLDIIPKKQHQCGSHLKTFLKGKFINLREILFFDKKRSTAEPEVQPRGNRRTVLWEMLSSKVNIKITCQKILFLKINYEEGLILMNLIKDAQEIINGTREFPLKKLALTECELYNLDPIPRSVETILLRKVKGLKNYEAFFSTCHKLRVVSCNDVGNEDLNIVESLLRGNPYLEILSLAKGKLKATGNFAEHQNYLRELYLDNCDIPQDVLCALPKLLPFVKRVQVYGKKCDTPLLHTILQIESLQWLFVWEFNYSRKKGSKKKKSILTEKSKLIQNFLSSVFDLEFAKKEKSTFILKKKEEYIKETPGTSVTALQQKAKDPFDAAMWTGEKLMKTKEKFDRVTQLDYEQFSYNSFFDNFTMYGFYDSTEADLKKKIQRQRGNANNNKLNPTSAEVTEHNSVSSVDDVDVTLVT